jgi:hypothetical protein
VGWFDAVANDTSTAYLPRAAPRNASAAERAGDADSAVFQGVTKRTCFSCSAVKSGSEYIAGFSSPIPADSCAPRAPDTPTNVVARSTNSATIAMRLRCMRGLCLEKRS